MQKIKSIFGYFWAALCLLAVLATFMGIGVWPQALAKVTGVRISPWYSGGEVARTFDHEFHQTLLHRPVFDGLFTRRAEGFVQIDWRPRSGHVLPAVIEEEFDVDGDGTADLRIRVETESNQVRLTPLQAWVLQAEKLVVAEPERILRIRLRNPT